MKLLALIALVTGLAASTLAFVQSTRQPEKAVQLRGVGATFGLLALAMVLVLCL
jgi:hypothetical protein